MTTALRFFTMLGATVSTNMLLILTLFNTDRFLGNNKGMGGSITAGCLIYAFEPDP